MRKWQYRDAELAGKQIVVPDKYDTIKAGGSAVAQW